MKNFIKGMTLLLAGISFMACSKDVAFDENAQKEAKAQAEIAQKFATYESDFVKTFGSIASGHKWGFDKTTGRMTRTAYTSSNKMWIIPDNFGGGNQNAEGWNANALDPSSREQTLENFDFNNYFLQHVEQPKGGTIKQGTQLQAWCSTLGSKGWQDVTNFSKGKNTNGSFDLSDDYAPLDIESTYFYGSLNRSAARTTLMADMGGAACDVADENGSSESIGKLFRVVEKDGTYNYNYGFFGQTAYHKESGDWVFNEAFLAFEFSADEDGDEGDDGDNGKKKDKKKKDKDNGNSGPTYWIIRIGEATNGSEDIKAEGRVFCEDMGANDFDFNDVVFDAWIMGDGTIKIKVLAHGGILPIAIDGQPVTLGEMTNTGVNVDGTQDITIAATSPGVPKYTTIDVIPITVDPNGTAGPSYNLEAPESKAPQKICAPIGTLWPKEYIRIDSAYSPFTEWSNMGDPAEWTARMNPELVYNRIVQ